MKKFIQTLLIMGIVLLCGIGMASQVQAKDADGDVVIVIDAGHGKSDPGSISPSTGVKECDCNYAIATAMKNELLKYDGVKVYLTRPEDGYTTNTGRAMVAEALHADFLISVHNNSGSSTNTGALAYRTLNEYYSEATNDMCSLILGNLEKAGLKNNGVQTRVSTSYANEDYYTLIAEGVRAGIPSIIVEHCFLSNETDAAFISNSDGTVKKDAAIVMGTADANAVVTYFNLSKRTTQADSKTTVSLEKNYSVQVNIPDYSGNDASWYSIDKNVATVDSNGVATAVSAGTTNIVYKLSNGDTGYVTLEVKEAKPIAISCGIDPTFYETDSEFEAIDLKNMITFELFSDGSVLPVKADSVGSVDFDVVGIQDIPVKYGNLSGFLRVIHNNSSYVPEVTLPAPTDPVESKEDTTTEDVKETTTNAPTDEKNDGIWSILKYVIVLVMVIIIAIILVIVENNKTRRRRNRRRRRY